MAEKYGKKVKDLMVKEIKDTISENKGFIFSNFENLKTTAIDTFRRQMRGSGSRYFVIKKSMADIALKESGIEGFEDIIEEKKSTGMGVITEDPVEIAKVMTDFAKKNKGFEITSGYLDGQVLTAEKVKELSQLPGREQLLAMVVGAINAPIAGFVNVLAGTLRSFTNVINAIKDKKE